MSYKAIRVVALGIVLTVSVAGKGADPGEEEEVLRLIGVRRGICAVLGDKGCELAMKLASRSELTVYVQLRKASDVKAARSAVDAAGMYNTRVYVERGDPSRIHLADNICDAVVAVGGEWAAGRTEALRVLRPEGKALLDKEEMLKPVPEGIDDWSHHYHGPDNNPQSQDQLARAPFLTQFIAKPRYMACPQMTVAAGGRIFVAAGHVAWHRREEDTLNTLIAINAYNGTILWKRALTPGIIVDRSTMIATLATLYLADESSCKLIDTASGKIRDEIAPPTELTGGTFWKWMALEGGVLYALVGQGEPSDNVKRWRRETHGWPWNGISDGYNRSGYSWGAGKTLLAIDPKTKKVLWTHKEQIPIDSRSVCMKAGRIFICSFGNYLASLDAKGGEEIWRRTPADDPKLFDAIGPFRPGHGWVRGWKSSAYLKCTDRAVYFVGPQVHKLTAVSGGDGRLLWSLPIKNQHAVIRDDGFYAVGAGDAFGSTHKLDPLTGETLVKYPVSRCGCTRPTGGVDGIFFRAFGGSVRLDLARGKPQWISPMRPSCHVGVVIANGQLYWIPWACDCNIQMFGVISLCPAGRFDFARKATEPERLETGEGNVTRVAPFEKSDNDWCTYRANNARNSTTRVKVSQNVELLWRFTPRGPFEATAPVAGGGMVFTSGSDGIVRAFDARSGRLRWKGYTGGQVYFPPTIADGRVLVGSGDGWAYAFEGASGRVLWRFRAAPEHRKIPLYGAMVSTWPVGGGVLVEDGVAYLAAGINNYDGTHVYALDVASGRIKWQNNTSGHLDKFSRRGVSVQGSMLSHDGMLYIPGGNSVSPGVYDMSTGQCLNDPPEGNGSKAPNGRELRLSPDGYAARRGKVVKTRAVTVHGQPLYSRPEAPFYRYRPAPRDVPVVVTHNARVMWERSMDSNGPAWKLLGRDLSDTRELWSHPLPGEPLRWGIAVDARGSIFVALRDGRLLCFGKK